MMRIEHGALRDALPAPSELSASAPSVTAAPEQLRLAPLETFVVGSSPWRPAPSAPSSPGDPLFLSLRQRALEVRVDAGRDERLRSQLDAVLTMTDRLGELATLSARIERERGRWLRA